jgi:hypothetical protein
LQAHFLTLGGEDVFLEEILIRAELNLDKIRWLGYFVDLAKVGALGHKQVGEATGWRWL